MLEQQHLNLGKYFEENNQSIVHTIKVNVTLVVRSPYIFQNIIENHVWNDKSVSKW